MNKHYGQIVEKVIRRNGYCISELARIMHVNRRSVYNWFNQKRLKPQIIFRIAKALQYDFSAEFPELFNSEEFKKLKTDLKTQKNTIEPSLDQSNDGLWKDKYIILLEKYNDLLTQNYPMNIRMA